MPSVSIIIPVYNDEKHIGLAIESAFAQTLDDIEVIVVDDGSTDGTSKVLEKYKGRVIHLRQENLGPAAARNAAGCRRWYASFVRVRGVGKP